MGEQEWAGETAAAQAASKQVVPGSSCFCFCFCAPLPEKPFQAFPLRLADSYNSCVAD